ncbi:MAG: outer membrane lipoprotein-sorting protein [Thiobacillus sp.]
MFNRFILLAALVAAFPVHAGPAEDKGLVIAKEADARDRGWGDNTADLTMLLKNKQGETSTRDMRAKTLETTGDGDKSLMVFDTPADVKGTALLSFSHKAADDEQWLYLPALKRVKRIASDNKSGPFMGSEFAYEDITSQEVEKYTYKWLRDEKFGGQDVFVFERYPVSEGSGYTRQVVWMDKSAYRIHKIDYYDRKQALLKSLTFKDYKAYGKYWRASDMNMINHQTGKSTQLVWKAYKFGTGLSARDFDQNALARAR